MHIAIFCLKNRKRNLIKQCKFGFYMFIFIIFQFFRNQNHMFTFCSIFMYGNCSCIYTVLQNCAEIIKNAYYRYLYIRNSNVLHPLDHE